MNIIEATKICLSKFATFSGRARRAEYWWFYLFLVVFGVALGFLEEAVRGAYSFGLSDAVSLGLLIPQLAVGARRLHDIGRSGWWQLLLFVPIIGWIVLIIWLATPGDRGDNRFGPDPLQGDRAEVFS